MAGIPNNFTTKSITYASGTLNGGLNTTAGPLEVKENESSDLQNIDFNKFGSILKRNGYIVLATATTLQTICDGLHWFEYVSAGTQSTMAIQVNKGKLWKMDALDGTWDNITGGLTITASNHCDFVNFSNQVNITNGYDLPFYYAGGTTAGVLAVPSGLTNAKYIEVFNNYLFYGNVTVGGVAYPTRIYWSHIRDVTAFDSDQWIEVGLNDGQPITRIKVLQDRLVVYKARTIYNVFFTGDADIPFVMPGGGKSNSVVGCIAPWSVQEVENGHTFLSYDGLYYYDGMNSYKLSDRVSSTLGVDKTTTATIRFDPTYFANAVSCVQKSKNRYFLALSETIPDASVTNNGILVWDYFNNAFSVYTNIKASAMATFYVNGIDERPHFGDYSGYTYRMDNGTDDYPLGTQTAINAYYYTNWKAFNDLCDQKGVPHIYLYYANTTCTLTFAYSYDFQNGDAYTQAFNLTDTTSPLWGSVVWGNFIWGSVGGGQVQRRDLTGRGRVARFKLANSILSETFRIDAIGAFVHAETNV